MVSTGPASVDLRKMTLDIYGIFKILSKNSSVTGYFILVIRFLKRPIQIL